MTAVPAAIGAWVLARCRDPFQEARILGQTSEILETIGDAFYALDRQGRFTYLNPKALAQLIKPPDQLLGRRFLEVFPEAAGSPLHVNCGDVMRDGKAREFVGVSPILKRWKSYLILPRPDGGILVHSRDVSAEKAAEQALLAERTKFGVVVEHVPVGLLFVEAPSGRVVLGNVPAKRLIGRSANDEPFPALVVWEAYDELGHAIEDQDHPLAITLATGEPAELVARYRRGDGTLAWMRVTTAPIHDMDSTVTGIVVALVDIDAERRSAEILRDGEARLRRAVEDAPHPIMVHADDGTVVHLSQAWTSATGYDRDDLGTIAGWTRRAYGAEAEAVERAIQSLHHLDGPVDEGEKTIRASDGSLRVWNFSSSPIGRDAIGRRLIVTMAVDLTERKRAEARLLLLMREVDHRAKNALTVVQSVLHLTRADNPADFIAAVEGRLASMARAHTLLAASHWSGADLRSLIVDELAAYGGPGRMVIAGSPVAIAAEATQAVAMNLHELATNAAKYGALSTAAGRVDVTWMVESADRGGCLTLDWVERGGPPVAVPEKIGFGSTMLRQTVETQLGGQLTLDWHPAGLMCRIAMPADCFSTSGVTLVPEGAVMVPAAADAAPGGRVLVVEDEALTALALEQVLMEAGFVVLGPVGRIEDALDILGSMRPDVAVLDVNLFGQDVYPVANRLVEMGVPFLFCSGYAKLDDIGEHLKRAPHLSKPVLADHLLATLTSLLGAGREDKAVA